MSARDVYDARGFGGRQGAGKRPAVVVVDFIAGFTNPASPLACDADAAVAATRQLLDAARAADATTVRLRDSSRRLTCAISSDDKVMDSPFQFATELSPLRLTLSRASVRDDADASVMLPSTTTTLWPIFGARLTVPRSESSTDTGVAGASSE